MDDLNGWQYTVPTEGSFIWIQQWDCGCCIMKMGDGFVYANIPVDEENFTKDEGHHVMVVNDKKFYVVFDGPVKPDVYEGKPLATAYLPTILPPYPPYPNEKV